MKEFTYSYPTRVYFGEGSAAKALPAELPKVGKTVILAYGSVHFASKVGQLAGNHFLTITDGLDRLYSLGRKCLYEGAQPITIELEAAF